jgi:hypothetical protein
VFPGAGHFAIGRPWRGAAWWSVAWLSVLLLPVVSWMPIAIVFLLARAASAVEVCVLRDVLRVPWGRIVASWFVLVIATLGFAQLVRATYLESFNIGSGAMAPTLQMGDRVFVN